MRFSYSYIDLATARLLQAEPQSRAPEFLRHDLNCHNGRNISAVVQECIPALELAAFAISVSWWFEAQIGWKYGVT